MDAGFWVIFSFVTVLVASGAIAGIVAGLLGVGGGIVIVPVLFWVLSALDFPEVSLMHVAVATSLATIVPTSIRSVMAHDRRGAVDWALLRAWAPAIAVGAVLGVILADFLETRALMAIFGVIGFLVALQMAFSGSEPSNLLGEEPPVGARRVGYGFGTGVLSALMGVGGGTFGVTLLTMHRMAIHRAVATSAGFGVIIAAPATIGFVLAGLDVVDKPPFTIGYVNLAAFAILTPMTVAFAPLGARIAHALPAYPLKLAFAFFLCVTALNMLRRATFG